MPPLFWLDVIALSVSTVIAASLVLMVLGTGLRRTLNRLFALFALMETGVAVFNLLLRMALWLKMGNPLLLNELSTLASILAGPLLLMFTVRYLDRRTRWADLAAALGIAAMAVLSIPLFRHQLIFNPHLNVNGTTTTELSTWGGVAAPLPFLYLLWSLVLFWQERRQAGGLYLVWSVLIMMIGFVVAGGLNIPIPAMSITNTLGVTILGYGVVSQQLLNPLRELTEELKQRAAEREQAAEERARLQQEVIEAQKRAIQELSTPIIPVMDRIIVMPLIGSIDTLRARDITRTLLAGIRAHQAKIVILDITGVSVVDSGVASYLNKTVQAARLKGARTIVTGISDAVAETIVDLGIDWSGIETLADLRTGLLVALSSLGIKLTE